MRCQAEPIFLCHRDSAEVDALVADVVRDEPLYDFVAEDGVRHTLWRVPWPEAFVHAFRVVSPLYVADGHHRAASASRARAHFRDLNPAHSGQEEYNRVVATVFPAGQLRILPYNRVVIDLGGRTVDAFLAEVAKLGPLSLTTNPVPARRGQFCLCVPGGSGPRWFSFTLAPAVGASVTDALDVSLLQDRVLAPLLGIDDPRTSKRVDFVGGIRGTKELERLVAEGRAVAGVLALPHFGGGTHETMWPMPPSHPASQVHLVRTQAAVGGLFLPRDLIGFSRAAARPGAQSRRSASMGSSSAACQAG